MNTFIHSLCVIGLLSFSGQLFAQAQVQTYPQDTQQQNVRSWVLPAQGASERPTYTERLYVQVPNTQRRASPNQVQRPNSRMLNKAPVRKQPPAKRPVKKTLEKPVPPQLTLKPRHIVALDVGSMSLTDTAGTKATNTGTVLSYEWRPNAFGLKVGYGSFGKFDFPATGSQISISGPMLGLTGRYHVSDSFALTAEGGASFLAVKATNADTTIAPTSTSAARAYGGIGMDYQMTRELALRVKYNRYASDFAGVSLGLSYGF